MDWQTIDRLIEKSKHPLPNPWLEGLQDKFDQHENYYRFLYHLLIEYRPKVALEIGTYFGIGSAYMAAAASIYGGVVIGLDLNPHEVSSTWIPQRYGNYYFIQGDSTSLDVIEQVREIVESFGPIGIVYQDSSHHYLPSCQEWAIYTQMLDTQAIWICDDITPSFFDPLVDPPGKGMVQYWNERPGDKRLFKDVLHFGNTQGIILL